MDNNDIRRLPDGELKIMQAIWDSEPPVSREDIYSVIGDEHPMAQTTLLTVLSRLADKGFIRTEKSGRSAKYLPLVTRQEYLARQSRHFLKNICGGSISAFAAALCDSGISREELKELRELLERDEL